MQGTVETVLVKVATGGDHFRFERIAALAGDLAEIRRKPGTHQRLEGMVLPGTHDLDLKVPAAGRSPAMVRGGAGRNGAGIDPIEGIVHHREGTRGRSEFKVGHLMAGDHAEPLLIDLARLGSPPGGRWHGPGVAQGGATRLPGAGAGLQVAAADVKDRVDQQILTPASQGPETDALGMSQEPGGLMVGGAALAAQGGDAELDLEFPALGPQCGARRWRWGGHRKNLHGFRPSPTFRSRVICL